MTPETTDGRVRTITGLLDLNERRLGTIKEATQAMHDVMRAVRETGKKGRVTIILDVEPDKNDELALVVMQAVKTSIPQAARKKAMVYHDPMNHAFTKTDPRQLELLAEQTQEKVERDEALREAGIAKIGRAAEPEPALATA